MRKCLKIKHSIYKYLNTYRFNNSSVKINFKIGKLETRVMRFEGKYKIKWFKLKVYTINNKLIAINS